MKENIIARLTAKYDKSQVAETKNILANYMMEK